jgi:hypothetical protein
VAFPIFSKDKPPPARLGVPTTTLILEPSADLREEWVFVRMLQPSRPYARHGFSFEVADDRLKTEDLASKATQVRRAKTP